MSENRVRKIPIIVACAVKANDIINDLDDEWTSQMTGDQIGDQLAKYFDEDIKDPSFPSVTNISLIPFHTPVGDTPDLTYHGPLQQIWPSFLQRASIDNDVVLDAYNALRYDMRLLTVALHKANLTFVPGNISFADAYLGALKIEEDLYNKIVANDERLVERVEEGMNLEQMKQFICETHDEPSRETLCRRMEHLFTQNNGNFDTYRRRKLCAFRLENVYEKIYGTLPPTDRPKQYAESVLGVMRAYQMESYILEHTASFPTAGQLVKPSGSSPIKFSPKKKKEEL